MARGLKRHGFQCPCGGVTRVFRTMPVEDGVLVRYRGCVACGQTFKSAEVLVTIRSCQSIKRLARAIRSLLVSYEFKEELPDGNITEGTSEVV